MNKRGYASQGGVASALWRGLPRYRDRSLRLIMKATADKPRSIKRRQATSQAMRGKRGVTLPVLDFLTQKELE